jgi:Purple acid Phosphatase, N-terminal domain
MKFFTLTAVLLLTICVGAALTQTPAPATGQQAAALPNVTAGPILEYASDHDAVIAWTSKGPSDMELRFGTSATSLTQTADAVENPHGTNHRVKLNNLQPSTTYYIQMLASGQPVGSVISFQTVAKGAQPNRSHASLSH